MLHEGPSVSKEAPETQKLNQHLENRIDKCCPEPSSPEELKEESPETPASISESSPEIPEDNNQPETRINDTEEVAQPENLPVKSLEDNQNSQKSNNESSIMLEVSSSEIQPSTSAFISNLTIKDPEDESKGIMKKIEGFNQKYIIEDHDEVPVSENSPVNIALGNTQKSDQFTHESPITLGILLEADNKCQSVLDSPEELKKFAKISTTILPGSRNKPEKIPTLIYKDQLPDKAPHEWPDPVKIMNTYVSPSYVEEPIEATEPLELQHSNFINPENIFE
ncbi:hypothetical protein PCANC_26564 [Puccinia coronata f. sp. avenae]|uniref:Uncharacterized protein n=1 Tax=Puccinia coronata f. sp. avenae TaxID=200324 RepID=A0A2N5TNL1_9BASI|nr:hypothetical protein PCANC_26564 [Puccinia coronata f. sp. avenae]